MIQLSTDYMFDDSKRDPYTEQDQVCRSTLMDVPRRPASIRSRPRIPVMQFCGHRASIAVVADQIGNGVSNAGRRPANSRLDCGKIAHVYGVPLPHWQSSLRPCVARILEEGE